MTRRHDSDAVADGTSRREVALLVPCYNAAPFLPRLVASIRAMRVPFTEVRCYDDGSTDDTVAVARALGLEIVVGDQNRGAAHARNQLAASTHAEWMHFQDADDPIAADFLERLLPHCAQDVDAVSGDADWVDAVSGGLHVAWRYDSDALQKNPAAHLLGNPLGFGSTLLRASAWRRIGGCDESLAMWEDSDLHFRLALAGGRFRHVAEVVAVSLRRAESFSHDYRRNWQSRLQALEHYAELPAVRRHAAQLAVEAEKAATALLELDDVAGATRAIGLCARLGQRVPLTNHPVFRHLRHLLPPQTGLRLRQWFRRRSGARPLSA